MQRMRALWPGELSNIAPATVGILRNSSLSCLYFSSPSRLLLWVSLCVYHSSITLAKITD